MAICLRSNPTYSSVPMSTQFTSTVYGINASYYWDFGDGFVSSEANPLHVYSCPGFYDVGLTATYERSVPGIFVSLAGYADLTTPTDYLNNLRNGKFAVISIFTPSSDTLDDGSYWDAAPGANYPALVKDDGAAPIIRGYFRWPGDGTSILHNLALNEDTVNDWVMVVNPTHSWVAFNGNAVDEDVHDQNKLDEAQSTFIRLGAFAPDHTSWPGSGCFGFFAILDLSSVSVDITFAQNVVDLVHASRTNSCYDCEELRRSLLSLNNNIDGIFWKMDEAGSSGSANSLTLVRYKISDGTVDSLSGGTTTANGCAGCLICSAAGTITETVIRTNYIQAYESSPQLPENQCCFGPYTVECINCTSGSGTKWHDSSLAYRVCKNADCASSCLAAYGDDYSIIEDFTDDCPACRECYLQSLSDTGREYHLTISNCQVYITDFAPDNSCGTCLERAEEYCFALNNCLEEGTTYCEAICQFDDKIFWIKGEEGTCGVGIDCGDCWKVPSDDMSEPFAFLPEDLETCEAEETETVFQAPTQDDEELNTPTIEWHNKPEDDGEEGLGTYCSLEDELAVEVGYSASKPDIGILASGQAVIAYESRSDVGLTNIAVKTINTSVKDNVVNYRSLGKARLINSNEGIAYIYDEVAGSGTPIDSWKIGFRNGPIAGQLFEIDEITRQPSVTDLLTDPPSNLIDIFVSTKLSKIYVVDRNVDKLYETGLDGGSLTAHTAALTNPRSITIDEDNEIVYALQNDGSIRKKTLSIGSAWTTIRASDPFGWGIAYEPSSDKVYYFRNNRIYKMSSNGLNNTSVVVVNDTFVPTIKIDAIHNKVYWTEYNNNRIRRCNFDGSGLEVVVSNLPNSPSGLDLNPSKERVYWSEYSNGIIKSAEFDGTDKKIESNPEYTAITLSKALKISVKQDKLYFLAGDGENTYYLSSSKLYRSPIVTRPYYEVRFTVENE